MFGSRTSIRVLHPARRALAYFTCSRSSATIISNRILSFVYRWRSGPVRPSDNTHFSHSIPHDSEIPTCDHNLRRIRHSQRDPSASISGSRYVTAVCIPTVAPFDLKAISTCWPWRSPSLLPFWLRPPLSPLSRRWGTFYLICVFQKFAFRSLTFHFLIVFQLFVCKPYVNRV